MSISIICSSETCKHYDCETRWVGSNTLTHSVICIDFTERCSDYTDKEQKSITKPVFYSEEIDAESK